MPLGSVTFLTPRAGLVALAVVLPLGALLLADRRLEAARRLLRLPAPGAAGRAGTIAALVAVPLLLGLAAAQPVVQRDQGQRVRTDAEAMYVVDISRSMAAAGRPGGENRLARARAAAVRLRSELPEVPSGLATLTDRALPSLFPVGDQATFDSAARALVLEQPPPQGSSSTATTFAPLADVARKGYFSPGVKKRLVVLFTDGESVPFDANVVADALHGASLVVLRVGNPGERVYRPDGRPEAYRPAQTAELDALASATGGRVFGEGSTDAAASAARAALGDGPTAVQGRARKTTPLAPYIALAAALVLLVILRRRNFTSAGIALPARGA